jgi:alpha-1,3-rhamnosyl/mannosyltransferase
MRICIDASPLLLRSGGVKNYVYYWVQHLRELAGEDTIALHPFLGRLGPLDHRKSVAGWWPTLPRLAFLGFANIRGNRVMDLVGRRFDLFHASNIQVLNPPRTTRLTATLYDMTCWLVPETHLRANVIASKRFARNVASRAEAFIAISEHTRADAVRVLGLPPEKIQVIYPGVAAGFFKVSTETVSRVRDTYRLARPYVLYVGTVEPRKNVQVLLDAYEGLSPSVRGEFDLVVAGPVGWSAADTAARLQSGIPGVHYLGYVPEPVLPALTAGAAVFAYPSLYEGFGLPVAQAMAAGVPVITSNVSSLPEVAGPGALFIDPRSAAEAREALERLLLSPALRSRLGTAGADKAREYRWELCAHKSLAFFEAVCSC